MNSVSVLSVAGGVACVVYLALRILRLRRSSLPLPPGPPSHGITGNLYDIPTTNEWETYTRWAKQYGPVVHFGVLTQHIVVLNTLQASLDLLEKRSGNYSDRPTFTMMSELMGWWWNTAIMPYGEYWRTHRRVLHHFLHEGAAKQYWDHQTRFNIQFLRALLETPNDFWHHIRRAAAASIMHLSHGIEVAPNNDPWVELADEAMETITLAGLPGSWAVDWLPFLKRLPEWFPGAGFKRQAREWRYYSSTMRNSTFDGVKSQMSRGHAAPSIAADLLQNGFNGQPLPEDVARNVTAVLYLGGADTTVSTMDAFFLAMVLARDKQTSAQEELDRVIGRDRLPEFADRESLPYVEAVMLEVLRLYPVLPLGLPHRAMDADEYQGMQIPRGATIISNVWAILRDETHYPNPEEFRPERYLKDGHLDRSVPDPHVPFFGWGRRVCVGKHFADASVWLAIATVLHCFTISPPKDAQGNDVVPKVELRSGLVTCPRPFACEIRPRSEAAKRLIVLASEQL